ncbi:hypothetical protein EXIGLDRAFT_835012 [Exidia glandulosa HHB12029]|uniref:Uncharacterized protein n=1 Tax=Exidia glandulosa HHB12029 TaxID=1314781 RepID=A0A165J6K2_EXIGL|nr:hypothetical protein EXIGLDRAFT_835012 [Exidia glandulosa HHB12029]
MLMLDSCFTIPRPIGNNVARRRATLASSTRLTPARESIHLRITRSLSPDFDHSVPSCTPGRGWLNDMPSCWILHARRRRRSSDTPAPRPPTKPSDLTLLLADRAARRRHQQRPGLDILSDARIRSYLGRQVTRGRASMTATTTIGAATTTTAAINATGTGKNNNVNDAMDTGIKDVEGCNNADGFTKCFEILGDSKESCFTIPRPLANNVAFWFPPPNSTCTLLTDERCTQNARARRHPEREAELVVLRRQRRISTGFCGCVTLFGRLFICSRLICPFCLHCRIYVMHIPSHPRLVVLELLSVPPYVRSAHLSPFLHHRNHPTTYFLFV